MGKEKSENKIAVLASTRGTDMKAIINAIERKELDAEIACVISNKPDNYALERARKHGIEAIFISPKRKTREEFDKAVSAELEKRDVKLILLIGYMRLLSPWFVRKYHRRVMNIHPSLLPEFAGGMDSDVHQAVLDAGKKKTGCTLHWVTEEVDAGPIIAQKEVPVLENDTSETLKEKVQKAEQELLIEEIKNFFSRVSFKNL